MPLLRLFTDLIDAKEPTDTSLKVALLDDDKSRWPSKNEFLGCRSRPTLGRGLILCRKVEDKWVHIPPFMKLVELEGSQADQSLSYLSRLEFLRKCMFSQACHMASAVRATCP